MGVSTDPARTHACHSLLVRLAGRLPDELLWRLRDWLAAQAASGAGDTVGMLLPRELMRHRVGLTDHERDLLSKAAGGWDGPARRLLDAVLPVPAPDAPTHTFFGDPAPTDAAALSVLAVVRGHAGCQDVSLARRAGGRGEQRIVLVRGGDEPWRLTATLQRVLRAQGDRNPCVEVLGSGAGGTEPSAYHRAAATAAIPLWRATMRLAS